MDVLIVRSLYRVMHFPSVMELTEPQSGILICTLLTAEGMPHPIDLARFDKMRTYGDELLGLMRGFAKQGLDYVEIERATIQALIEINKEFNMAEGIQPASDK